MANEILDMGKSSVGKVMEEFLLKQKDYKKIADIIKRVIAGGREQEPIEYGNKSYRRRNMLKRSSDDRLAMKPPPQKKPFTLDPSHSIDAELRCDENVKTGTVHKNVKLAEELRKMGCKKHGYSHLIEVISDGSLVCE